MFFKRLSRGSRSNSYVNDDDNYLNSRSAPEQDSPRHSLSQHNTYQGGPASPTKESQRPGSQDKMFQRSQAPSDPYSKAQQFNGNSMNGNGNANGRGSMPLDGPASPHSKQSAVPPPDLLTQAFNQAVIPYTEKIADLEAQVAEMQQWVEKLEAQQSEVHSWIDKRGLRPGTSFNQYFRDKSRPRWISGNLATSDCQKSATSISSRSLNPSLHSTN